MALSASIDPDLLPEPFKTRMIIWRQTKRVCEALPAVRTATKHIYDPEWKPIRRFDKTTVEVWGADTFVAAQQLVRDGFKIAVLNLADDSLSGGNIWTGSSAQEESLFRRSTIYQHLPMELYPLGPEEALYAQKVVVFRGPEAEGYPAIKPFTVDIISCPGVRHPKLVDDHLTADDTRILLNKIRLIYQACSKEGADSLVSGALGCGAWRNPADDVAKAFKRVADEYDGVFQRVIFAILPPGKVDYFETDLKQSDSNLTTFQRILSSNENNSVTCQKPADQRHITT